MGRSGQPWWAALTATLAVLMTTSYSQTARYYFNATIYLFSLAVCSILGIIYPIGLTLIGQRFNTNMAVARSFYALAGTLLGIKVTIVEGEEYLNVRPSIIVGNHQSFLDILYLGKVMPRHSVIMAKQELQWMPLLGQFSMYSTLTRSDALG